MAPCLLHDQNITISIRNQCLKRQPIQIVKTAIAIGSLVLGFLLSPYGIPMIGTKVIDFLKGINEKIR